jgi:hypothetical protein
MLRCGQMVLGSALIGQFFHIYNFLSNEQQGPKDTQSKIGKCDARKKWSAHTQFAAGTTVLGSRIVDPDPHQIERYDPDPNRIKVISRIPIRIKVISCIHIRILINLHMTS